MTVNQNSSKKKTKDHAFFQRFRTWLHSSSFKCIMMDTAAVIILLLLFFSICVPKKYNLSVRSIAHETINAPKDVVDEVATQEKRDAAAAMVEPTYHFQQGVKEDVLSSLSSAFNELYTVQQYGATLLAAPEKRNARAPFSEDEIDYAFGLLNDVTMNRNQLITILSTETQAFEYMVSTVTTAVENSLNTTIREGQVTQSIQSILQIVGWNRVDVSLTQNILPTILRACIQPNMTIDQEATAEARQKAMESVEPVVYLQGQNIIREGEMVTKNQLAMLRSLGLLNDNILDYSVYFGSAVAVAASMICLFMLLKLLCADILSDVRRMAVVLLILVLCVGLAALSHLLPSQYIIPLALGSILATVLIGYRVGICMNITLSILVAMLVAGNNSSAFYDVVLLMSMSLTEGVISIWFLKGHPQRVRVLIAGLLSSVISVIMIVGIRLLTSVETIDLINIGTWAVAGGILSGVLAVAFQPVFESVFRLATPSKLLELTNPSQPLMKRLMIEAPGTYHHSIIVANLAEAAADSIGANPFLARAGAYYHDIGKLKRPGYFKENQNGDNPHERTDPYVSAAIVTSHTMDGVLLAQKERMPREVQDIILQHHGVTPVMYFYHKALQLSNGSHVDINEFRYAGPKPQTKEAAVVMLADTIEAAVRSMKSPTPKAIDQFIEQLVRGKLEDGQLSDSPLSLRDIDKICEAFSGILKGVYHERIEYPQVRHYANGQVPETEPAPAADESLPDQPAAVKKPSEKEVADNET